MTNLAKALALICIVVLCVGMYGENVLLAVPATAILVWMIAAYAYFHWVHRRIRKTLVLQRRIQDRSQSNVYLWADRLYSVELTLKTNQRLPRSLQIRDIAPDLMKLDSSESDDRRLAAVGAVDPSVRVAKTRSSWFWEQFTPASEKPGVADWNSVTLIESRHSLVHRYRIRPRATGIAIFPGVRVEHKDPMNWFRADYVVECRQVARILPKYREEAEIRQLLKTTNSIPQHGFHRQRKPGMGFELLELREYVDGDPPKSIAWKASARRDTLMIRQYESEVPVRLQLFVEGTVGCRVGSFGYRVVDQMASLSTSLAKIVTSHGDAVGGYFIDRNEVTRVSAEFGESGFYKIAKALSQFCSREFPDRFKWTSAMQNAVYALIGEYYPDLLQFRFNPSHLSFFDLSMSSQKRQRNQVCNVLAEHYKLSDWEHVRMIVDESFLAKWMQRYLCEHGREWVFPMIPEEDIPHYLSQNAIDQLIRSVQQAVQIAKDNEVFVLMVDLLSADRDISRLLQSLKVARGKHHRVVVVSQSPTFEPIEKWDLSKMSKLRDASPESLRRMASQLRIAERFQTVKLQLNAIGVPFSVTSDDSSISSVLREVDLARSGRLAAKSGSAR
ncbi:MAG: DUF58 domain-containing protein [Pirellula sp.]|jgi:hypothetical protein|nr:DUF58 domain-containing protein [Pirellula sp.]